MQLVSAINLIIYANQRFLFSSTMHVENPSLETYQQRDFTYTVMRYHRLDIYLDNYIVPV